MKNKHLFWPFIFYFIVSAAAAAYRPYLVLYFQSLALSGAQIGLLVGAAPLVTMVAIPLITGLADRTNRHGTVLGLSLLGAASGLLLLPHLRSFALLFVLAIVLSLFISPVFTLINNAAMVMLGERKDLYGRVRVGGTIGFSLFAVVAGILVENYGLKIAFWGGALLYASAFFVNQRLVHRESSGEFLPEKGRARDLLQNAHFLMLLLIGFAGGFSYAANSTFLFPYLGGLGAGEALMGLALTTGTLAEIPVLFFAGRFIRRFSAFGVLVFSTVMVLLRFLLFVIVANPIVVVSVQVLHGLTHPLLSIAGVTYADEHAPGGLRATAQGLFNVALSGVGAAFGGFVGGVLFESLGAQGMYLVFAGVVTLILVLVGLVRRLHPQFTGLQSQGIIS